MDRDQPWIVLHKLCIWALHNNSQIGCVIVRLCPMKCTRQGFMTNPWITWMPNPHIASKKCAKCGSKPILPTGKGGWSHIHPETVLTLIVTIHVLHYSTCIRTQAIHTAHSLLEWLRTKMTWFRLPSSFLASCSWDLLCRKEGFFPNRSINEHMSTYLTMRGQGLE